MWAKQPSILASVGYYLGGALSLQADGVQWAETKSAGLTSRASNPPVRIAIVDASLLWKLGVVPYRAGVLVHTQCGSPLTRSTLVWRQQYSSDTASLYEFLTYQPCIVV